MLVEMIPKEPLSFSVFHYKNPKLQHTVQVPAVPAPPPQGSLGQMVSTACRAAFPELSGHAA